MGADSNEYSFFPSDRKQIIKDLGKKQLVEILEKMLLIRNFEMRAESAYLHGKVGGFFHSYIGQEAVQTAAVQAIGQENWWTTSYRCHALALLLGASPDELMAELYGKVTGNAKGRGGSMHFFTDRLLGGFGIVGGQLPIATGAAFTAKYKNSGEVSTVFLGDGAVAQGSFHESLNLASLWDLPCLFVIENNQWGMGTAVNRAISVKPIAEKKGEGYGIEAYTLDGMDFFSCYGGFAHIYREMKKSGRPVLVEVLTQRFKGHSISDPALYRPKDALQKCMDRDPIELLSRVLVEEGIITDEEKKALNEREKQRVILSMEYAEKSPFPNPITLEEDVFAT